MSQVLAIVAEQAEANAAAHFAHAVNLPFDAVLLGDAASASGADRTWYISGGSTLDAASLVAGLASLAADYALVIGPASMFGKDLLPRLAAALDWPMISDVSAAISSTEYERPVLAGAFLEQVALEALPAVVSFRTSSFTGALEGPAPVAEPLAVTDLQQTRRQARRNTASARPDLGTARVVVSGGRPLKDAATFEAVLGSFADAFGAAVGATRAAVDAGIAPNDAQVGQTGKVVAPDVYIAAGVSGSTQHVAGMKDSKLIVAINKDPNAPIFDVADLGLVADLYEALPALRAKLRPA
jgi:electron transfer flavoprotein alpha subunit